MAKFRIPNRDQLLMFEVVDLKSVAPVGWCGADNRHYC